MRSPHVTSLSSLHLFTEIESNLVTTMNSLNARTLKLKKIGYV